jgi:hypothetical protein
MIALPQTWVILSHALNIDERAVSQSITNKISHMLTTGVRAVVPIAVTGNNDRLVEHRQVLTTFSNCFTLISEGTLSQATPRKALHVPRLLRSGSA